MELLLGAVRPYAWGSRTVIAELLGEPVPSPHPQAELWFGAHHADPSRLRRPDGTEECLDVALRRDPVGLLGPCCQQRWEGRLPFLLKVLAAEEPLSLQAHPSAEQAAVGFAREQAAGIPREAPERNYPDPGPKPELLCALTDFTALVGFRDADDTVRLLRELAVPQIAAHVELLAAEPGPAGLRALFTTWITLPQNTVDELVPAVLDGCVRVARGHGEFGPEARIVLDLGERYPDDPGVLAALLLNRIWLKPGEAVFVRAGHLHTYLSGVGVEVMANCDNVLRGGLTPKHVDVVELLRVLDFSCGPVPTSSGDRDGVVTRYRTPAEEFELSRVDWPRAGVDEVALRTGSPRILLCTSGSVEVAGADGRSLRLGRGDAVWLSACDPPVMLRPQVTGTSVTAATDGLRRWPR